MLYVFEEPEQIGVFPVIVPGVAGVILTVIGKVAIVPFPQAFVGVTVISPDVEPIVTVMEFVFVPAVIVAPVGIVQVYPVAPDTAVIEYILPVVPEQTVPLPEILPAALGVVDTVI